MESLDIRFTEILNELDSLGVPAEMFTASDKALAVIRSLNSDWSTEKATYQTQNSHDTLSYVYILEMLKNMENERNCNNQAAQPMVQALALSAEHSVPVQH